MTTENKREKSNQKEHLAVSWIIAALIAFSAGYGFFGCIFAIKGCFDLVMAIDYGLRHVRNSE